MKKISLVLLLTLLCGAIFGVTQASAFEPYDTYTYSIDGEPLKSPTAYRAEDVVDALKMDLSEISPDKPRFNSASDIVTDELGNVYIADKGNNRIVVLDKYYKATRILESYFDEGGELKTFNQPQGLFVSKPSSATPESYIYICDTGNRCVVVFDREFNYVRTIKKPDTPLLEDSAFVPCAIAVDLYGRIFITSSKCFEGVIVLSNEGDFTGFSGSQKVTYSPLELIWRRFQTKEQREASVKKLAMPYSNITVDDEGFIYVTTTATDMKDKAQQVTSIKSKSALNSPVKKLNSAGTEIMKRNGFFDPGGEVVYDAKDVSTIVDVAMGKEGSWSLLDSSRSRIFTYDQSGNLLFAFGDKGDQLGNGEDFVGMTYQVIDDVYYMLVLDNSTSGFRLTVFSPTRYYDTIISALSNQNKNLYSESIFYWQDVRTQNNNFDLAYIGIGKALFNQGKYEEAQDMLSSAYETEYHSKAFMEIHKDFIQKYLLLVVIGAILLVYLLVWLLGKAKKKNKAVTLKVGRKSYAEELVYICHLIFHPFDGFWDLKHEKRGSVRASLTIMLVTVLAFFYQAIGRGYSYNPRGDYSTVFIQVIAVVIPVALWCVGNWCLTTLFDGEGSFKDIIVATGYALAPLPVFVTISTILTNVMTASEGTVVSLLVSIGYVWAGILLFFGMLVTHGYTINKNIATILGTVLAMAIIIFVVVLFSSLVAKMVTFIIAIFTEIGNRA
jgi:hypothetical protein